MNSLRETFSSAGHNILSGATNGVDFFKNSLADFADQNKTLVKVVKIIAGLLAAGTFCTYLSFIIIKGIPLSSIKLLSVPGVLALTSQASASTAMYCHGAQTLADKRRVKQLEMVGKIDI